MQVRGLSPRTCSEYEKNLRYFARWAGPRGLRWSTLTRSDVNDYIIDRREIGDKPATCKLAVSILRSFFRWMVNEGMLKENPLQYSQSPKTENKLPVPVDIKAIDMYLAAEPIDDRDKICKIFTALVTDTGLRIQEALDIDKTDIDFQAHSIKVKGKGNKERLVYYSNRLVDALCVNLQEWNHGKLFNGIDQLTMRQMVYEYLGRWIPKVHPHQLRHTFATECLNNGMRIETVSRLLGHSSVQVTERYARLVQPNIEKEYTENHP